MGVATGTFQYPNGSPVANGIYQWKLSGDAVLISGSSCVAPTLFSGALDPNGNMTATFAFNDVLTTTCGLSTTYQFTVKGNGGGQIWNENYFLTGTAANLNTIPPACSGNVGGGGGGTTSGLYVLISPTALQTVFTYPLQVPILDLGTLADTGLSRGGAGIVDVGNGGQGSTSGTLNATGINASGNMTAGNLSVTGNALIGGTVSAATYLGLPARTGLLGYTFSGGGTAVSAGVKGTIYIPVQMTVTGWVVTADQTGSASIAVLAGSYSAYPTVASITGTDVPGLTSLIKNENLAVSVWTPTLAATTVLMFSVTSATTVQTLNVGLIVSIPYA